MAKSEFAQAYMERMFPEIASPAGYIDPEFEDLFENFAFHEVITEDGCNVAAHSRFLAISRCRCNGRILVDDARCLELRGYS